MCRAGARAELGSVRACGGRGILGKLGRLCRLKPVEIVVSGNSAAIRRSEACQSGRMGLPAKELSLRGPQVQILSPPQLRQSVQAPELPIKLPGYLW